MSKIAVIYWSSTGNTESMANSVVEGIKEASQDVDLFKVSEFDIEKVSEYDAFAFGCPAMGAENLEDSEFEPAFEKILPLLGQKKIALFGSYGWGGGEWMRIWTEDCISAGANIVCDAVIVNDSPDDDTALECKKLGAQLA